METKEYFEKEMFFENLPVLPYLFSKTYPSFLIVKEGSTSHPSPLSSGAREKTALRCSEPLRYKVVGPSKVYAMLCGLVPSGEWCLISNHDVCNE